MSHAINDMSHAIAAPAAKAVVKRVDTAHDLASDSASLASSLGRGCSSVGSFDAVPSDRTPSLSGSETMPASPGTHAVAVVNPRKTHQRAQRLLVRVPSTGAVVVVENTMLFFGKHKQRGKPLTLCPAFDCADPSAAVCPDAASCNCVHADVRHASLFQPHQRSAAMFGQYPRMRGSELVEVTRDDDSGIVDCVPPGSVLITRAQEMARRPLRHCAHFLSGKCNRGSECEFAHVVPTMGSTLAPAGPATKAPAPAAVPSRKKSTATAANDRTKTARSTPAPATHVDAGIRRSSPASPVLAPPVLPGHHAMPAWHSACPAHCVPSAASVVSSSWQTLS